MRLHHFIELVAQSFKLEPSKVDPGKNEAAAVLALVAEVEGEASFGLTVRQKHLPVHPGQVAFPGGRIEIGESPIEAAIREAKEEIGIKPSAVTVCGALPPHETVTSGYLVWPVVGFIDYSVELRLAEDEVSDFFWAPVSHFAEKKNRGKRSRLLPNESDYRPAYNYGKYEIWGLTLRIIETLTMRFEV